MAYTKIQTLRKMRATNKGSNQKLARALRETAAILGQIGPEDFTDKEIRLLELTSQMLLRRVEINKLTKDLQKKTDAVTRSGIS